MAAKVSADDFEDIKLLKDEAGGLLYELGISTVTFYKCGDSTSFKHAVDLVRTQFEKVVAANPWLAGKLVSKDGGVVIRHPAQPSKADIDALFTATSVDEKTAGSFSPSATATYVEMCTQMYSSGTMIIGSGTEILDKKDKVITILSMTETTAGEFALIFSISHAVADGRTYYEIFNMLRPGSTVWKMTTARIDTFSEIMRDNCGRKELEWADTTSTTCLYTCSMMFGGKTARCVAFDIDPTRLASAKEAAVASSKGTTEEVQYVTTNDVITSAFFNETSSRIGMMGMDCRNRLEGVDKELAGNYVTALTMDSTTFSTPAAVRKMLNAGMPYQTTGQPLPSCCGWCCGKDSANFAMATNWASFAGGLVKIEHCDMSLHLPLYNPAYAVFDLMIPFAKAEGKMGVLCWTVSSDEDGLRAALPVGDCVSRTLFPNATK